MAVGAAQAQAQTFTSAPLPPLVNSAQALQEGIELYDKGEYDAAIARYTTVTPGDSLYPAVQSELAYTYVQAKRYPEALASARRALELHFSDPQPYVAIGMAEEELKHADLSEAAYVDGLKRYPYNQNLWYNRAISEINTERFALGLSSLKRSVEIKPTHPGSHFLLANLAIRQGQTSHAMLSLMTYLLISPDGSDSHDVLVALERQASHTAEVEPANVIKPFLPNEAFQELDLLIDSKVALRKDYVSKVKFDANLVKQVQLLVEKFPSGASASSDDYWLRLYGPLVEALRQGDNLTTFTYVILASADDKKAAQWIKGNKSKIEKLYNTLTPALLTIREQQPVVRVGKTELAKAWFDDNGRINGLGEGTVQGEERRFTGPWTFVTEGGAIEQEGSFGPDFKRTGLWRLYHDNGQLARTSTYENGELTGLVRDFHDNGQPASEMPFKSGKAEGEMKVFSYCGELSETRSFKQGDLDGDYRTYYAGGKPKMRVQLRADKQQGPETHYYPDGTVEYEYTFVDGKKQGPFQVNYADKTPEKRGTFEQDELHGLYTEYFSNGKMMTTGTFAHGKRTGTWKEYFADGALSVEKTYDEAGELHGTYHDYNYAGKLFSDLDYEHGRLVRQRYYNPSTGKNLLDTPIKKGKVAVQQFGTDGISTSTGSYLNGQMDGEWRWNYPNGKPKQVRHYAAGQLNGVAEDFYANGQLKQRSTYVDGVQEGAFESFLRDGQRYQTGYYRAGQQQGPWKEYYADGQVSEEYEMHQGQKHGPTRSLAPNGKATEARLYEFGRKLQVTTFDTTGRVVSQVQQKPDTREFVLAYPGGKVRYRTPVACYQNQGPATWFFASGKPEVSFHYADDLRDGPYKSVYENGKTRLEGLFRNGNREGEWREYYPSGQLRSLVSYRQDNQDGQARYYHENGKPDVQQTFLYGVLEGPAQYYNPLGELIEERLYEQGDLVGVRAGHDPAAPWQRIERMAGTIKTTFANGKTATEETVAAGVLDGTRTTYYSSGQLFRRLSYKEGLLSGQLVSYYPSGKLQEDEQYLHGELHGRSRYYRPDGTLEREETYRSGEKLGPTTYYNAQGKPAKTEVYWNQYVYDAK